MTRPARPTRHPRQRRRGAGLQRTRQIRAQRPRGTKRHPQGTGADDLLDRLTASVIKDYLAQRQKDEAKIAAHLRALASLPDGRALRGDRNAHRALSRLKWDHKCQVRWTRKGIRQDWKDFLSALFGARLTYTDETHPEILSRLAGILRKVPPPHSGKRLPAPWSESAIRRAIYRNGGVDECLFWFNRVKDCYPSTADLPLGTRSLPRTAQEWIEQERRLHRPTRPLSPVVAEWLRPKVERQRRLAKTQAEWAKDKLATAP